MLDLRNGDAAAATLLWERYFALLVQVAKKRLARAGGTRADADEEDAALSAFLSFCTAAGQGRFPDLSDREELWRLLVVITAQSRRPGRLPPRYQAGWAPAPCGGQTRQTD